MFDFVVIGAGSAGCVLAHRLVSGGHRVALVEAGGSDRKLEVRMPAGFTKLFKTERDWNYTTVPQRSLEGRTLFWPRGKMLGGCSSMNAQMWVPGFPEDYDAWAESGAEGWDHAGLRRFLERAELGAEGVSAGRGGIVRSSLRSPNEATAAFLEGCSERGMQPLGDPRDARPEGFSATLVTQYRGRRFSAADGYLRPALRDGRLTLISKARVERILFEGKIARGVALVDARGEARQVFASREVVLSAGAVNSPQLLMLSGVGDPAVLRPLGIPVVQGLPGVGRNLQDHLMAVCIASCPRPVTLTAAESIPNLLRYVLGRTGMLTSNIAEAFAYVRTRRELRLPDIELLFAPVPFVDHGLAPPKWHGISIGVALLQPESRGRIKLRTAEPSAAPDIDPGYLTDTAGQDLRTLVGGLRVALELFGTRALAPYADRIVQPDAASGSDAALEAMVRAKAETLYHPVGTCRMGDDATAVVDAELRVHGVQNLRVVDASVMPRIVRGHPHAAVVLIAEKAAELILAGARAAIPGRVGPGAAYASVR